MRSVRVVCSIPLSSHLCASGTAPPTEGNAVELLPDGEAAYAAIVRALDDAARTIDASTLISPATTLAADGGGAGWIRINTRTGSAAISGALSPAATPSCATQGTLN